MTRRQLPRFLGAALAALTALAGCSPGTDGTWTVLDDGLLPAQLRVVRGLEDGGLLAAGYHDGGLDGLLLRGEGGRISADDPPGDLLWDYHLVAVEPVTEDVIWAAGTAHLFRIAGGAWETLAVPEDVVDGVTAAAFVADGAGWIVGQGWDGPRIYRFEGETFYEEPCAVGSGDVSLASIVVRADGTGYAAGATLTSPQEAVLLERVGEEWVPVDLPAAAADVGPIRDLAFAGDGTAVWAVGNLVLTGDGGAFEVADFPYRQEFTPRVAAFPAEDEGWIAGFGVDAVAHLRWGRWEFVPPDLLAPDLEGGSERTWLFDDAHFARRSNGWFVGAYIDCRDDGTCREGQALLHYDRDDTTVPWDLDRTWVRPRVDGVSGPALVPSALALASDDHLWLTGDEAPDDVFPWGQPVALRENGGGGWIDAGVPGGVGIFDIQFLGDGRAWAVGSETVDEEHERGAILLWDGTSWVRESFPDFDGVSDWELRAVDWTRGGQEIIAVGRAYHQPLALVRRDGAWQQIPCEDHGGSNALLDVTIDGDGTIWAAGTVLRDGGWTEGLLLRGDADGLDAVDLTGFERWCGGADDPGGCWSLRAIDAWEGHVAAVGEATMLQVEGGVVSSVSTNMTLVDVRHDTHGRLFVLAENGWWLPREEGWEVRRTWDPRADESVVLRLQAATRYFGHVVGFREFPDDLGGGVETYLMQP